MFREGKSILFVFLQQILKLGVNIRDLFRYWNYRGKKYLWVITNLYAINVNDKYIIFINFREEIHCYTIENVWYFDTPFLCWVNGVWGYFVIILAKIKLFELQGW